MASQLQSKKTLQMSEDGQDDDHWNKTDDHCYHKAEPRRSDGEDLRECQEYLGPKTKGENKTLLIYIAFL